MKTMLSHFLPLSFLIAVASSAADTSLPTQLTIDLRDGSRVVGRMPDETMSFHADALGDIKLAWAGIRAIESTTSTNTARLTTTSGDQFTGQMAADTLHLETGFGKTEIAVNLIRSVKVSTLTRSNTPASPVAAAPAPNPPAPRLTVELRDGSHVVGTSAGGFFKFRSPLLGELKLGVNNIRSAECVSSNSVKLTVANGDTLMAAFADSGFTVLTSFGKVDLAVGSVRKFFVSASRTAGTHPPGLVALWSGEGDGKDAIGNIDAGLTGIEFAEGQLGQAFSLNGTSSSVRIPASPTLDVGMGDGFTIIAWIKPANLAQRNEIFEWNNGETWGVHLQILAPEEYLRLGAGNLYACVRGTDRQEHIFWARSGTLIANAFQQVGFSYDKVSGIARLFCNGVIVAEQNIGHVIPQTSYDLYFGKPAGDSRSSFSGLIDEASIYNRALSGAEIRGDYDGSKK